MFEMPLAVTGVGSLPRPGWLCTIGRLRVDWHLTGDALEEGKVDAVRLAVDECARAGLDIPTDGEQRRDHFVVYFCHRLTGFDLEHRVEKTYRAGHGRGQVPRIVGDVTWSAPISVDDFRLAQALTDRPVKMAVPGPMTLWDTTYDAHYGDPRAVALACADAMNRELKALVAAGCQIVQIDEPAFTRYPELVHNWGVEALNRALDGVAATTVIHLCYGYPLGGNRSKSWAHPYTEIFPDLAQSPVDVLSLETAAPGTDLEFLREAPADKIVMLGVVDVGRDVPEPAEEIAGRLRAALDYLPADRLWVAPDFGLAHLTRRGAGVRLQAMVAAAAAVRSEVGT